MFYFKENPPHRAVIENEREDSFMKKRRTKEDTQIFHKNTLLRGFLVK